MPDIDDLTDPITLGEDLSFNARETMRLAAGLCAGCADLHIVYTAVRPYAKDERIEGDRDEILAIVRSILAERIDLTEEPIDVVLAGSADTGLLATCAHAAAMLGAAALARTRFMVLDLCPTPLVLCAEYARRHGLTLATRVVDLSDERLAFPADIVLVHSVFRYLPVATRPAALARLGRWLKPEGRIVFSNSVFAADEKVSHVRSAASRARLDRAIADGSFDPGEPLERFLSRMSHRKTGGGMMEEFDSLGEAQALFDAAGLHTESLAEVVRVPTVDGQNWPPRRRVLAVLRQAG